MDMKSNSNTTVVIPVDSKNTVLVNFTNEDGQLVEHRYTCATPRAAQIVAATEALRSRGWKVCPPGTSEGYRRPLMLPGEQMMRPLDGSRVDERAQGFTAFRGPNNSALRGDDILRVDASAGLPLVYLLDEGDTGEARALVEQYLRPCQAYLYEVSVRVDTGLRIIPLCELVEGDTVYRRKVNHMAYMAAQSMDDIDGYVPLGKVQEIDGNLVPYNSSIGVILTDGGRIVRPGFGDTVVVLRRTQEYMDGFLRVFAKELASRLAALVPDDEPASSGMLTIFACDLGDDVAGEDVDRAYALVRDAARDAALEVMSEA